MNIVIIGLPGSGKTHLSKTFPDHIIFDDFISTLFDGKLQKYIKNDVPVCINDPRLCDINIYNKYDFSNFKLILFENNYEQCLENIKLRNNPRVEISLKHLNEKYDLNNYSNYQLVPVYKLNYKPI